MVGIVDGGIIGCCDLCGCPIFDYEPYVPLEEGLVHASCLESESEEE